MYGLIVRLTAAAGRRADLIRLMRGEDSASVPGCLSFIVAEDATDEEVLWITEVWESQEHHEASLKRPLVQGALTSIDTLITAYEKVATSRPVERSSHPLHGEHGGDPEACDRKQPVA